MKESKEAMGLGTMVPLLYRCLVLPSGWILEVWELGEMPVRVPHLCQTTSSKQIFSWYCGWCLPLNCGPWDLEFLVSIIYFLSYPNFLKISSLELKPNMESDLTSVNTESISHKVFWTRAFPQLPSINCHLSAPSMGKGTVLWTTPGGEQTWTRQQSFWHGCLHSNKEYTHKTNCVTQSATQVANECLTLTQCVVQGRAATGSPGSGEKLGVTGRWPISYVSTGSPQC